MAEVIAHEPAGLEPASEAGRPAGPASAPRPDLLGAQLAHARRRAGLTQRELADRLGVRLWTVEQWESGAKPIPHEQFDSIADAIESPVVPGEPALASRDTMATSRPLTAQEIREARLPRSLRGYDEAATRRLLDELAAAYERVAGESDELRRRVEELESTRIDPEAHAQVVAERDELRERVEKLGESSRAEVDAAVAERDELRKRVDELAAEVAEGKRAATRVGEAKELRRRVEELETALAGYEGTEQSVSRALVAASRAADELRKEAEAEAQAILDEARRSAEEIQRDIDDRRDSFENEHAAIVEDWKREAFASARDDLAALEHAAEPVIAALAVFEEHIRAIASPQAGDTDEPELLDDLKASPPDSVSDAGGD